MLKHRVISGSLIVAGLLVAAFCLPAVVIWVILLAVNAFAQYEFYRMMRAGGIPVFRIVGMVCGAAMITATFWASLARGSAPEVFAWDMVTLAGALIAICVRQLPQRENERPLETISCTLLGIMYVTFLFNFINRLTIAWEPGQSWMGRVSGLGREAVLYLVVVVKASDIGAFFVGRSFGRHKLFPRISPKKTWEGLAGGLTASVVVSVVYSLMSDGNLGGVPIGPVESAGIGLCLAGAGVIGDVFESLMKRATGLKDSSSAIPGMGGILDVLDSLLFAAPVLYAVLLWQTYR